MSLCSKCGKEREGLHSWCKKCCREAASVRYWADPKRSREKSRKYAEKLRREQPEVCQARKLRWLLANPDKKREIDKRASLKYSALYPEKRKTARRLWKLNNRDKVLAEKRQYAAAKRGNVPGWANMEQIKVIYAKCPAGYHVDHIVPLRGKFVNGLHVEYNLQYLPAKLNCVKGNRIAGELT